MLTKIARLEKLGGFRLRISFTDGTQGVHDFTALLGEPAKCWNRSATSHNFLSSARRLGRTVSTSIRSTSTCNCATLAHSAAKRRSNPFAS
jgi:hypothetical protein